MRGMWGLRGPPAATRRRVEGRPTFGYVSDVHLFGLTGGIASGKSTVARRLRERGVPVIDADALAREVVVPGTPALRDIAAAFGDHVLAADRSLDRQALGRLAFADDAVRAKLNAIMHPRIASLTIQRAGELAARGEPLACYEAALIVENGSQDGFRPLIVVAASSSLQIARLRSRDGMTEDEAIARVRAQASVEEKLAVADHVIDATRTIEENRSRTDEVLAAICVALGVDISRYPLA